VAQNPSESVPDMARRLMRAKLKCGLATLDRVSGAPYVSMVNLVADHDGHPLLLLSDLARHTANLTADARASLLLDDTDPQGDPATGARLTLMGRCARTSDPAVRERYLARLPAAAGYVDFGDFGFWRFEVERGHFIGGFGRIHTLERADLCRGPDPVDPGAGVR
jgi:heme iron utilization protein